MPGKADRNVIGDHLISPILGDIFFSITPFGFMFLHHLVFLSAPVSITLAEIGYSRNKDGASVQLQGFYSPTANNNLEVK